MLSDTKYVALGLVIGISATALLISVVFISGVGAKQPVPPIGSATPAPLALKASMTGLPSPVSTLTPTYTPIPTLLDRQSLPIADPLLPPNTPDPVLSTIVEGGLIYTGPLSNAEQVALYRASLAYVQTTPADSRRISKEFNGVGYGDPTNICGPLAIAILRDAGLIAPQTKPHDFWLLNPMAATDQRLLEKPFQAMPTPIPRS